MPLSNTWTPSLTCTLSDITISGLSVNLNGTYTKVDDYNTAPSWVIDYGLLSNTEPGYVFIRTYNSNNYIIEVTQRTSSTWVWGVFNTTTELWEASGANTYTNSTLLPCPSGESWVLLSPPTADLFTMAAEGGGFETPGLGNGGFYGYNYSNSPEVLASKNYGLNIGSRRSVNVITPTFDRDFVTYGTLNHGTGPNITFTRASSATVFTSTGILSTVPDNVPRFEWGSFRTNYIRNSTMAGAVVGVIGGGGSMPSYGWNNYSSVPGVSAEIVGTGTTSGLNYIDIKFSGTNTGSTNNIVVRFDATTQVAATSGQTWTGSVYLALVGGDFSGYTAFTPLASLIERNSQGTFITSSNTSISGLNATLQRIAVTRKFDQAATVYGQYQISFGECVTGSTVNTTLRFAAPQYELSSAATAFIPTTNAPVTTGVPLGLLIEESRTNLFTRSAEFSANPPWSINNLSVSSTNVITAPDGSYQASKLVENADVGSKQIWQTFSRALTGTPYTGSVYMKAGERQYAQILMYNDTDGTFGRANIKLTDGSLTSILGTASAVYVKDGWYRVFVTATPTFSSFSYNIFPATNYGVTSYTGDGTSGIYVWGAQLEQGSFPTSYIPTAGLSATRAADIALTNDLSFYNQDQGTLYTEILKINNPSDAKWASFTLSTNTTQNITIQNYAERHEFVVWNSTARSIAFNNNIINSNYKLAGAYQNSNFQATQNGVLSNPILNFIPSKNINRFSLGSLNGSQFYLNNYLRKVTYWPTRLSNNRLRTLTLSA